MFNAEKYNKKRFDLDTNGFEYRALADCFNDNGADYVYTIGAIYINTKSQYGNAPVFAVTDGYYVNVPKHMLNTAVEMLNDDDAIKAINAGKVGFKIYPYTSNKYHRDAFSVDFVNIQ